VSALKLVTLYGLLIKLEASYNAGGGVAAATDGVLLMEPADLSIGYVHEGERGRAPGSGGRLRRGRPSGKFGETTLKVEGRGRGSAYGASALPEVHALMRLSGHNAVVDSTLSSEKVTYTPASALADFGSGVAEGYARGQKYPLTGIYADFGFTIDGPGFLVFEFPISGLVGTVADASVPAITYSGAEPPKAVSIALTIGAFSPVVRSVSFKANRKRSARADVNAPGHKGFSMGSREPEMEIVVEAAALATFDPYAARDQATQYAVELTVGDTQYNRMKFTAAKAQIANVVDGEDEETALWTLTMPLAPSTPVANDDYEFAFT
jgi:hypothetical protein